MIMPRLAVARILLFGIGNSGDSGGNGNRDFHAKNGAIAVAGREDGFVLRKSTKWLDPKMIGWTISQPDVSVVDLPVCNRTNQDTS